MNVRLVVAKKNRAHTNDSDIVLWGFKFPESNIDGDTALTLGLELV